MVILRLIQLHQQRIFPRSTFQKPASEPRSYYRNKHPHDKGKNPS